MPKLGEFLISRLDLQTQETYSDDHGDIETVDYHKDKPRLVNGWYSDSEDESLFVDER